MSKSKFQEMPESTTKKKERERQIEIPPVRPMYVLDFMKAIGTLSKEETKAVKDLMIHKASKTSTYYIDRDLLTEKLTSPEEQRQEFVSNSRKRKPKKDLPPKSGKPLTQSPIGEW